MAVSYKRLWKLLVIKDTILWYMYGFVIPRVSI